MYSTMKGCVPAAALLFLSASATFASVDKIYDGKTRSILNNRRAPPVTHEEYAEPESPVTINDDFEWLRIKTHSFAADISRESPSNDDPDFVDQLLQTSVATDGTRFTQSPTFKPSNQFRTSVSPTSFQSHSTMPTQQVSSIPTSDEVTIGSNSTQLIDMNVTVSSSKGPTSSSPLTATRLTQSPTFKPSNHFGTSVSPTSFQLHSTMPTEQVSSIPTSDEVTIGSNSTQLTDEFVPTQSPTIMNVTVSSSKGPTLSSPLTATRTTGIPTTRLTSPSSFHDLGPSQHHQYHENGSHEASSNNTNEAIGSDDDVIQVDLPQIICDITTSPSSYQNLERKHVLLATMTNMMYDLLDTHLPKLVYDLKNISLKVEVKKNNSDNLVPTVRLHAYFRGATFFSSRASPTRDDLITLLLRYFDVDKFSRRLMLPFRARGVHSTADELIEVNSCYFTLEDGSLIEPGFEYEEKTLPNTGTLTGLGMQVVLLLSALIGEGPFLSWPSALDFIKAHPPQS